MSLVWANTSLVDGVPIYANSYDLGGGIFLYANSYDLGGTPPAPASVGGSLPRRGKWKRHRVEAAEAETATTQANVVSKELKTAIEQDTRTLNDLQTKITAARESIAKLLG